MFVTERVIAERKVIAFDFEVNANGGAGGGTERFHVEVEMETLWVGKKTIKLKLLVYDRISKYEPYRACAYKDTPIGLCICDKIKNIPHIAQTASPSSLLYSHYSVVEKQSKHILSEKLRKIIENTRSKLATGGEIKTNRAISNNQCLYLRQTKYLGFSSISYEVVNICKNHFKVTLMLKGLKNCKTTRKLPFAADVLPYSIIYLGGVLRHKIKIVSRVGKTKLKATLK